MYVYVLETFDRCDEYCDYDSKIVAVYAKENLKAAKEHWKTLCKSRTSKGNKIEKWQKDGGYFFSSEAGECESYQFNYVGLKKMEVQ